MKKQFYILQDKGYRKEYLLHKIEEKTKSIGHDKSDFYKALVKIEHIDIINANAFLLVFNELELPNEISRYLIPITKEIFISKGGIL